VTLPFWDQTSEESLLYGIPWALTDAYFMLDDFKIIPNPLISYTLPQAVEDPIDPNKLYSKPEGYETVRYPLSGLVGNDEDR
jgi:tyrosinase